MRGERAHDAGQFNLITAWRAARNKQFQAAERLSATSLDVLRAAGVPFFIAWALVEAAIISEWTGKAAKADDALDEASRLGETLSNQKITWASLMVRAILLFARNERTVGMDVLRRAFAIGSGSGFMHFFFFPPHEIASLCVYALDAGIEVDYALELIRRHDLRPPTGHPYTEEWPWPIKIFTMNRFAILRNGEPLAFNRKTQKRPLMLLKALIGRGGRDVKETDLADDLWPLAEGDAAHQALATTLFRLRKLVGEDIVLRLDGRLTLNANICWVDAWALEKQLSETQSDDPLAKARGIARLYAGPFESDDESAPWATPLRESLRHKAITALVDAGRALQQKARHRDAIEVFQHGLRLDDLVEEWYRGLMVSYAAENRRSEAIELYRQLAARLKSGLNMVPSKQTEVVYAIVSGRDASTRSPGG